MLLVDTNVLLYAAERSFPEHVACRELVEGWRTSRSAWYTTWPIVYEFLRVSTHLRVFRTPWSADGAWSFVEALLASPGLSVLSQTGRAAAVVREVLAEVPDLRGNIMHDTHTAILMREHGIRRICTRDTDFFRFPFLEVVDPLTL